MDEFKQKISKERMKMLLLIIEDFDFDIEGKVIEDSNVLLLFGLLNFKVVLFLLVV